MEAAATIMEEAATIDVSQRPLARKGDTIRGALRPDCGSLKNVPKGRDERPSPAAQAKELAHVSKTCSRPGPSPSAPYRLLQAPLTRGYRTARSSRPCPINSNR
jgi:hypothetical protein